MPSTLDFLVESEYSDWQKRGNPTEPGRVYQPHGAAPFYDQDFANCASYNYDPASGCRFDAYDISEPIGQHSAFATDDYPIQHFINPEFL